MVPDDPIVDNSGDTPVERMTSENISAASSVLDALDTEYTQR